jgi:hypothetical protein
MLTRDLRDNLVHFGIDQRTILNLPLKKEGVRMCTRFVWYMIGHGEYPFEKGNQLQGYIKRYENMQIREQLLVISHGLGLISGIYA